jgi:hypothetical protein
VTAPPAGGVALKIGVDVEGRAGDREGVVVVFNAEIEDVVASPAREPVAADRRGGGIAAERIVARPAVEPVRAAVAVEVVVAAVSGRMSLPGPPQRPFGLPSPVRTSSPELPSSVSSR